MLPCIRKPDLKRPCSSKQPKQAFHIILLIEREVRRAVMHQHHPWTYCKNFIVRFWVHITIKRSRWPLTPDMRRESYGGFKTEQNNWGVTQRECWLGHFQQSWWKEFSNRLKLPIPASRLLTVDRTVTSSGICELTPRFWCCPWMQARSHWKNKCGARDWIQFLITSRIPAL